MTRKSEFYRRILVVTAVFTFTLLGLGRLLQPLQAATTTPDSPQATALLYNSNLGSTPDQQSFTYQALNGDSPLSVQASQSYSTPVTILNTTEHPGDYAGYSVISSAMPTLNRAAGFQLSFNLRLLSETHSSDNRS